MVKLIENILATEQRYKQFIDDMTGHALDYARLEKKGLKKLQMKVRTLKYLVEAARIISLNSKLS